MFQAARLVGRAIRDVKRIDGESLSAGSDAFAASFIFAGQIGKEKPRLFQIYSAGNFIEATPDTPFFQIGEHKYGKPILDRVARNDMKLGDAAKMVLLSFDSTLRSNLSVGLPIDMLTYETGSLKIEHVKRIGHRRPLFQDAVVANGRRRFGRPLRTSSRSTSSEWRVASGEMSDA